MYAEHVDLIEENHSGIRGNFSTFDNMFTLKSLVALPILKERKLIFRPFVDIKAGFN